MILKHRNVLVFSLKMKNARLKAASSDETPWRTKARCRKGTFDVCQVSHGGNRFITHLLSLTSIRSIPYYTSFSISGFLIIASIPIFEDLKIFVQYPLLTVLYILKTK